MQGRHRSADSKKYRIGELVSIVGGLKLREMNLFVFYDLKSGKHYKDVKRSFALAVKRAKIHDFKFHDLRHTFASHLIMAGVDITTVKELLGHKDIKMTLRYAHLAPSHKVKAVDLLDSTINEQSALKPTIQKLYNQGEKELTATA